MGETFNMAQCLDNQMCSQYITGSSPPNEYNIKGIHLPDLKPPPVQIFSWYLDLKDGICLYSAEICIVAMLLQAFVFLVTIFDFIFSDNQGNMIRQIIKALITVVTWLYRCFCPVRYPEEIPPQSQPTVQIQLQPLLDDRHALMHVSSV